MKAARMNADYVQILRVTGPHLEGICLHQAFVIDGLAYKRVTRPAVADPPVAVAPSTQTQSAAGTGFRLLGTNLVLTNAHVVEGAARLLVRTSTDEVSAGVVIADRANDVAILRLAPTASDASGGLTLGESHAVRQGDRVWSLGYPLAGLLGDAPVLSEGTVTSVVGPGGDPRLFQISAPAQPGSSGSPLFDSRGRVVGLVVSTLNAAMVFALTGAIPQNVNFDG
jgi:S1-C subfamily serine protease